MMSQTSQVADNRPIYYELIGWQEPDEAGVTRLRRASADRSRGARRIEMPDNSGCVPGDRLLQARLHHQRRSRNSSIVTPACRMMLRSVPGFRSRPTCTGTVTARAASSRWTSKWWLPAIRSTSKPRRRSARIAWRPVMLGRCGLTPRG